MIGRLVLLATANSHLVLAVAALECWLGVVLRGRQDCWAIDVQLVGDVLASLVDLMMLAATGLLMAMGVGDGCYLRRGGSDRLLLLGLRSV